MKRILVIWGNWGPYHHARFAAFRKAGRDAGYEVEGLELFPSSGHYQWETGRRGEGVHHLNIGPVESRFHPWRLTRLAVPRILSLRPDVVFVPSYWHWSLYLNLAARMRGSRIVMMNESHGGTEKAKGWKKAVKKAVVRRFHAALIGGSPHHRYFAELGLPPHRIFSGYDAVDNDYFTQQAAEARLQQARHREELGLPRHYFLSLGRMVEKKNLPVLVKAYALFRTKNPAASHELVLVGTGEEEPRLRALAQQLGLSIQDHLPSESSSSGDNGKFPQPAVGDAAAAFPAEASRANPVASSIATATAAPPSASATVHFYGFRQIEENPVFYGLADAFILPSRMEEWGLVVNEAMACGLPVVISRQVGCAENLVSHGTNGFLFEPESAEELAAHLGALAENRALQKEMGAASLERISAWGCDRFAQNAIRAADAALARS